MLEADHPEKEERKEVTSGEGARVVKQTPAEPLVGWNYVVALYFAFLGVYTYTG
jgi:hypothetical protein